MTGKSGKYQPQIKQVIETNMTVSIMALHLFYYNFQAFYLPLRVTLHRLHHISLFIHWKYWTHWAFNTFLFIRGLSCLEIMPQSAFTAFRALLPSANYFAGWSGRVLQPLADSNDHFARFFKYETCRTAIKVCSGLPHPTQQVKILKKVIQRVITICSGLSHPTGWAAQPS
jgi:hypothetical protein